MIFSLSLIPYFILGIIIEFIYTSISYFSSILISEILGINEKDSPTNFHIIEFFILFILNMVTAIGENYSWPNALSMLFGNQNLLLRIDKLEIRMHRVEGLLQQILYRLDKMDPNGSLQPVSYFLKNTNSVLDQKKENYK